jgi:hypothetical protein
MSRSYSVTSARKPVFHLNLVATSWRTEKCIANFGAACAPAGSGRGRRMWKRFSRPERCATRA